MVATMHYIKPKAKAKKPVLKEQVSKALEDYFSTLDGEKTTHLYNLVLAEVEAGILQATLNYTQNNQSTAANILGVNRGTFRKKMSRDVKSLNKMFLQIDVWKKPVVPSTVPYPDMRSW